MAKFYELSAREQDEISMIPGNICGRLRNPEIFEDYVEGQCCLSRQTCSSKLPMSQHKANDCKHLKKLYSSIPKKFPLEFIDSLSLEEINETEIENGLSKIPTSFWAALLRRSNRELSERFNDKFYD